jgi:asparagine N-glycosylation enzyme membrane subunit Stt3
VSAIARPRLRYSIVSMSEERSKLPVAASLVLMLGAGALLAGLTDVSVWSIPMDYLGVGIGTGLEGASVALADAETISIEAGLAGAFGVGIVAAMLLALVARRLPETDVA